MLTLQLCKIEAEAAMIESQSRKIRLRTACDPCSTAKVRCDKKHPACDRCTQIHQRCSYSESRKHGRQPWRKRLLHEQTATIPAESRPLTPAKATMPVTIANQTGWDSLLAGPSEPLTWENQLDFGQNYDPNLLSSWPSDGVLNIDGLDSSALAVSTSDISTEPSPASSSTNSSTHNCEAEAISILSSMQHGEMYHGLTSCSTDPGQAYATLILSPSFDRVLAVNKAAREGWNKLVRCPCALCPHLLLLYTSILSKMLFWYHIAATEKLEDTESGDSASSSGSLRYSPDEAPTVDRFSIRPTAIQVGTLSLTAEDQAHMRRVLLKRELHTTAKAIDDLMNVDRKSLESADEYIRTGVQWALTGISRHKEQLQAIIQIVEQAR